MGVDAFCGLCRLFLSILISCQACSLQQWKRRDARIFRKCILPSLQSEADGYHVKSQADNSRKAWLQKHAQSRTTSAHNHKAPQHMHAPYIHACDQEGGHPTQLALC